MGAPALTDYERPWRYNHLITFRPGAAVFLISRFSASSPLFPRYMVRRANAREKLGMKEGLRKCIRPVGGEKSPGHDEIRRVPVLQNASAV